MPVLSSSDKEVRFKLKLRRQSESMNPLWSGK